MSQHTVLISNLKIISRAYILYNVIVIAIAIEEVDSLVFILSFRRKFVVYGIFTCHSSRWVSGYRAVVVSRTFTEKPIEDFFRLVKKKRKKL